MNLDISKQPVKEQNKPPYANDVRIGINNVKIRSMAIHHERRGWLADTHADTTKSVVVTPGSGARHSFKSCALNKKQAHITTAVDYSARKQSVITETIGRRPAFFLLHLSRSSDELDRPRVLEVLVELVHPDRVVHLPLVRVQSPAGRVQVREHVGHAQQADDGDGDQGHRTCGSITKQSASVLTSGIDIPLYHSFLGILRHYHLIRARKRRARMSSHIGMETTNRSSDSSKFFFNDGQVAPTIA